MTTDPAAMLDAAAARLRELAGAATEGPWKAYDMTDHEGPDHWWWVWRDTPSPYYAGILRMDRHLSPNQREDVRIAAHGVGSAEITDGDDYEQEQADAAYIAAMSPPVALALADWLDRIARGIRDNVHVDGVIGKYGGYAEALAVARAILGPGWAFQQDARDLAESGEET